MMTNCMHVFIIYTLLLLQDYFQEENLEDLFLQYYVYSDIISMLQSSV